MKPTSNYRISFLLSWLLLLALFLSGCTREDEEAPEPEAPVETGTEAEHAAGSGMAGMGQGRGMMERHQAPIPAAYAGLTNPVAATEASLASGADVYTTYCATCHGDGGMGDGPTGQQLDPAPAPIAHTSQMLGDDYLFWRISEGGAFAPFNSAMPAWQDVLEPDQRWDVVNYVRGLGDGTVTPGRMMGGALFDPEAEQAQRVAMLETAVEQEVISRAEADLFGEVHDAVDRLMAQGMTRAAGSMGAVQEAMLVQLVNNGTITEEQAESFRDIHDRLLAAGLMQ